MGGLCTNFAHNLMRHCGRDQEQYLKVSLLQAA